MMSLFLRLWVLVLGLVFSAGTAQATTDWDDGFEYANNTAMAAVWANSGGASGCPGVIDVSTTRFHSGAKSLKVTYGSVDQAGGCFMSRFFNAASDTVYGRVWIYLDNFTPNSTGTKMIQFAKENSYPNFWWETITTTAFKNVITNDGNGFTGYIQSGTDVIPQGQWTCMEMRITMNTPGQANGIMQTWKNGSATPGMNVTNGQWRGSTLDGFNGPNSNMQFTNFYRQHGTGTAIYYDDYGVSRDARIGCGGTPLPGDAIAPSVPTNLQATSTGSLSWIASTDNVGGSGVANYPIKYCTGAACTPTLSAGAPTATDFTLSPLTPGTIYGVAVSAVDNAGNPSGYTATVYFTATATFRAITFSDTFAVVDGANPGANYTHGSGSYTPCKVVSQRVVPTTLNTECFETYTGATANDQWAQADLSIYTGAQNHEGGVQLRWTADATPDGYLCYARSAGSGDTTQFSKYTAGVFANISGNATATWQAADQLRCEMEGTAYRIYQIRAGVETLVLSGTDASFAAGKPGVYAYVATGGTLTNSQTDNFVMGDFSGAPPAAPTIASVTFTETTATATTTGSPTYIRIETYTNLGVYDSIVTTVATDWVSGVYTRTWPLSVISACLFAQDAAHVENRVSTDYQCNTIIHLNVDHGPQTGVLRHLGSTPWLTDDSGNAIVLNGITGGYLGDGTNPWTTQLFRPNPAFAYLQDIAPANNPYTNDWQAGLATITASGLNFVRLWIYGETSEGSAADYAAGRENDIPLAQMPYKLVGTRVDSSSGSAKTVGIYDLSQPNPVFFNRLRERVLYAVNHGVVASIMPFVYDTGEFTYAGFSHPYLAANNVNGVSGDTDADGMVVDNVSTLLSGVNGANILALQKQYVHWVIDALNDLDPIIWEICNECTNGVTFGTVNTTAWAQAIADEIIAYEATGGRQAHLIWGSPYIHQTNANMIADTRFGLKGLFCDGTTNWLTGPTKNTGTNPWLYDTDHQGTAGVCKYVLPAAPWKMFTSGFTGVGYLDGYPPTDDPTAIRLALSQVLTYAGRMGLKDMQVETGTSIIASGYGLYNACVEYLMYQTGAATNAIDLSACGAGQSFTVEYLNPATGAVTTDSNVAGGASRNFTSSGARVVYLKLTPPPTDTTPPTIFGCTPTGVQVAGTTSVTMQCFTDEAATLKYGSSSGVSYASQPLTMTANGAGTTHTATISGLGNGDSITRYVLGSDATGNVTTSDTVVSFSIGGQSDMQAPVMSNPLPNTDLPAGTTSTTFSFTIDENATCKWDTTDTTFALMANTMTVSFPTASATKGGLTNGSTTTLYARCQDYAEPTANIDTVSLIITITVASSTPDVTPPGTVSGLVATITGLQVELIWTAATGGDVAGYYVYQCFVSDCSDAVLKRTLGNTTTTFLGLNYSTLYYWAVKAFDTSNNPSAALSNIVTGTTGGPLDIVAPSTMTNLRLVSAYTNSALVESDPGTDDRGSLTTTLELAPQTSPGICGAYVFIYSKLTLQALVNHLIANTGYCVRGKFSDGTNLSVGYSNVVMFTTAASGLSQPRNLLPFGVTRSPATRNAAGARNPRP